MLRVSKLTDYATVVMHYLAGQNHGLQSARGIAEAIHLPLPTVSKVLKSLVAAGLVISTRGAEGGYTLAKPANEITLIAVITALEGNPALTECTVDNHCCQHTASCAVQKNWKVINSLILQTLSSITVCDMTKPLQQHAVLNQLQEIFAHE